MPQIPKPKQPKFGYTSKSQVKVKKPKQPKFGYTSKSQVKITKPAKPRKEGLSEIARTVLFEKQTKELTIVNPQTKNRIKVTSALKYPHEHPAFKAAAALLKKKNITLPTNIHATKPGEQLPLFNLKPYEDPNRAAVSRQQSALAGEGAEEHLKETQSFLSDGITPAENDAINEYTGAAYQWINASLRGDEDFALDAFMTSEGEGEEEEGIEDWYGERLQNGIYGLDKVFKRPESVLTDDVLVYRGIGGGSDLIDEIIDGGVGTLIEDKGFVSTSINEGVARHFAGWGSGAVLKIIAKKGTRAIYPLAGGMGQGEENELILNRDSKFKVVDIQEEKFVNKFGQNVSQHVVTCETVVEGEEA